MTDRRGRLDAALAAWEAGDDRGLAELLALQVEIMAHHDAPFGPEAGGQVLQLLADLANAAAFLLDDGPEADECARLKNDLDALKGRQKHLLRERDSLRTELALTGMDQAAVSGELDALREMAALEALRAGLSAMLPEGAARAAALKRLAARAVKRRGELQDAAQRAVNLMNDLEKALREEWQELDKEVRSWEEGLDNPNQPE